MNIRLKPWVLSFFAVLIAGFACTLISLVDTRYKGQLTFTGLFMIFIAFSLGPIILDWYLYKLKIEADPNAEGHNQWYYPNLQLWGVGPLLGVIIATLYVIGRMIPIVIDGVCKDSMTIIQNLVVLIMSIIILIFLIWALTKLYRTNW
jgi:hypothetical protein